MNLERSLRIDKHHLYKRCTYNTSKKLQNYLKNKRDKMVKLDFFRIEGKRIISIEKILSEMATRDLNAFQVRRRRRKFAQYVYAFRDELEYRPALEIYCNVWNEIAEKYKQKE